MDELLKPFNQEEYDKLEPMQRFWYRRKQLKNDFPYHKKVVVRTVPYKTLLQDGRRIYGYCEYKPKTDSFIIVIERNVEIAIMIDILWHEYSHVLTWDTIKMHCNKFWKQYGEIYRKYLDE
jgi:hypothetical protein